jgi:hypothetical protein
MKPISSPRKAKAAQPKRLPGRGMPPPPGYKEAMSTPYPSSPSDSTGISSKKQVAARKKDDAKFVSQLGLARKGKTR